MSKTAFHALPVSEIRRETPDCVSLLFDVPPQLQAQFAYEAGQYLTLRTEMEGEEVRRSYSLCSAPYENAWRVAVKAVPGGRFSSYANADMQPGDLLEVMPPMGSFHAPREQVNHIVCFAAGSGITPILSIIKEILHVQPEALVTLFYGNRSTQEIIFREEIEGLKNQHLQRLRVYHILTREHLGVELFFGRIDGEKFGAFAKTLFEATRVDHFYFCGPEPMIRAGNEALQSLGVEKKRIHFELFGAPKPEASLSQPTVVSAVTRQADLSRVAITIDNKTVMIDMLDDGLHLLEAALSFGLELPFACKGGVCSTCKCRVTKGEVLMDKNYALEPDEVDAGYVLSCQARPISDEVAVTFDV